MVSHHVGILATLGCAHVGPTASSAEELGELRDTPGRASDLDILAISFLDVQLLGEGAHCADAS